MSFTIGLIIISSVAGAFWLVFLFLTRNIRYFSLNTDNQLLTHAAAQSNRWRWLSDLHKFSIAKTGMLDVTIICIALFQKLFRDKEGDFPYIALGGFTAALSTVLVYLVGANFWNPAIGLTISLLLLVSFWLWQVALYGGQANTAAVFFLFSVYIIQQTNSGLFSPLVWLFLAGIVFGLTQLSSRSAIKYTPLFLGAIFYEQHGALLNDSIITKLGLFVAANYSFFLDIIVPALIVLSFLTAKLIYKRVVTTMYFKKAPAFLNKMIENQNKLTINYYLDHANNKINYYFVWIIGFLIFFLLAVHLLGLNYLWPVLAGTFSVFFVFTLPDNKKGFKYFLDMILETQIKKKSHFRLYVDYFAKKSITVSRYTQGGGWRWLPKIFFRMAPWHSLFFLISMTGLVFLAIWTNNVNLVNFFLVTAAALSPIFWAQITGAPQIARTFSPGLISMLMLMGYFLSKTEINLWFPVLIAIIPAFLWNLWKFFTDIYPARMVGPNLTKTLLSLNIKEFYTYDTEYNNALVRVIDHLVLKNIKVNYIQSLREVKDGWVVVPGTSSKAMQMESEKESIKDGDYMKDPILNKLLETRHIENIASAKFKTSGTSNIWVQESEVTSYRDLMLKEITDQDRFRGYAWLINAKNLPSNI